MLLTPLSEPTRRRLLAGALALAVNSSFIALILFTPREAPADLSVSAVDVVFVTMPAPEPEPVFPPVPETEASESIPIEQDADVPAEREPVASSVNHSFPPDDQIELDGRPTADAGERGLDSYSGQALPYPAGPGSTAFFLRETLCLSTSDANREAGNCRSDSDLGGLGLLRHAGSHDLTELRERFGLDLSADEIRVLNGLAPYKLDGQSTVDTSRRSTSSSDEMRETLPASRPDPAFGD